MNTGILATAWMSLLLGQTPANDIDYRNQLNLNIPFNIEAVRRNEIREVILFASTDEGRNWHQADTKRVKDLPTDQKTAFAYYANREGLHWLKVAVVNRSDKQEPDDQTLKKGLPDMKIMIDRRPPIIRMIQAQRHGDEVYVTWDVQEDNPSRDGARLEYQTKDALSAAPVSVPITFDVKGQGRFRPGHNQPLVVRLTVRDLAGNESFGLAEVPGTVSPAGFSNSGTPNPPPTIGASGPAGGPQFPTLPGQITLPSTPTNDPVGTLTGGLPPPPPKSIDPPAHKSLTPPGMGQLDAPPSGFGQASIQMPTPPPPKKVEAEIPQVRERIIGDSRQTPASETAKPGVGIHETGFPGRPVAMAPNRKPLPPLLYVNQHQVTLEYEVRRVGPSGVGGIELWLTRDDGQNWELFAEANELQGEAPTGRQKRSFDFLEAAERPFADGVYGMILSVKNRAGLGRKPRPGDVPEIRVEIDTKLPVGILYQPQPDPQRPDHVLLKWHADDKNLTATSISLEYAEKSDGPWHPIQVELENKGRYTSKAPPGDHLGPIPTGDFSWKAPPNTPPRVYLRLRVRDKAGNERIVVSSDPEYVDLTEPEGSLIGVQPATKNPQPMR